MQWAAHAKALWRGDGTLSRNSRQGGSSVAGSMVAWSVSVPEVLLKSFFVPCLPSQADTCLPKASSYPKLFPARDT